MNRDGRDVPDGIHLPDFFKELLLAVDVVWVRGKKIEEIKFTGRKGDLFSVYEDAAGRAVDLDPPDFQDGDFRPAAAEQSLIAGEMRLDPRDKLARREGLCHIIVRAESEPADLIDVVLSRGDQDDRDVLPLPHLAADFEAVLSGEHEIQDQKCIVLL